MSERKPTKIEDQALTVYHFWICSSVNPEKYQEVYQRYLHGLFELLGEELPEARSEARKDAYGRLKGD